MILVIGQNSVWQHTCRVSAIRRGKVNRVASMHASAAGKGANVTRALTLTGIPSHLLAFVGGALGTLFADACRSDGLPADFVNIEAETRICTTLIDDRREVTEIVEPAPTISERESAAFGELVRYYMPKATMLVMAGTAVNGEAETSYREFVKLARRNGAVSVLDSYRTQGRLALEAAPEILKINSDELGELTSLPTTKAPERRRAATDVMDRHGVQWVIVTMGAEGAEGYSRRGSVSVAAPEVEVANTIGSGDAFTAGVCGSLYGRMDRNSLLSEDGMLHDAVRRGIALGTANCLSMKPGDFEPAEYRRLLATLRATD